MTDPSLIRNDLSKLFAYKAEWLKEKLFHLFTAPKYLSKLAYDVPCVLIGGRGTGKTTVLRGMSYDGQFVLRGMQASEIVNWEHFGFYLRINSTRVTAFAGPEVTEQYWQKLFGHYLNLLFVDLVLEFGEWFEAHTNLHIDVSTAAFLRFERSLSIVEHAQTIKRMRATIADKIVDFEQCINNIEDESNVRLSMLGSPIDLIIDAFRDTPFFSKKQFSFLVDEYENLTESQQQVANTLIKHASSNYTFKIGVRELGWRCRTTLNPTEQLISPADYRLFNISEELLADNFADFAELVCNARLAAIRNDYPDLPESISDMFPALTLEEEALKLGAGIIAKEIEQKLGKVSETAERFFEGLSSLEKYFIKVRADSESFDLAQMVENAATDPKWQSKFENHSHALLFTLRKGKRGIRKFYCGWRVFSLLANGNLRYLIELVDLSIAQHLSDDRFLSQQILPETQTKAAQQVGKKNLAELEGLSIHGAKLSKLLLGLGRIFGIMAEDAEGHAPEVNQFELADSGADERVDALIDDGVMHLALVRFTGTKAAGLDTKDYDYSVHPIFAPFFVFSHRKKRKMTISRAELIRLVEDTKSGIAAILAKSNRTHRSSLPDQLTLFGNYFDGTQ